LAVDLASKEKAMFNSNLTPTLDNARLQARHTAFTKSLTALVVPLSLCLAACAYPEGNEAQSKIASEWCGDLGMTLDACFEGSNEEIIVDCRDNDDNIVTFYLGSNGELLADDRGARADLATSLVDSGTVRSSDPDLDTWNAGQSGTKTSKNAQENIWVTINDVSDVPVSVDGHLRSSNPEIQAIIDDFNR
jgi:hypothetical protein